LTGTFSHSSCSAQAEEKVLTRGLTNVTLVRGDVMGDGAAEALRGAAPFDVITCSSALIYMPSVPAALRRFASWLAPSGRLAVNSPMVRRKAQANRLGAIFVYAVMLAPSCLHMTGPEAEYPRQARRRTCLRTPASPHGDAYQLAAAHMRPVEKP